MNTTPAYTCERRWSSPICTGPRHCTAPGLPLFYRSRTMNDSLERTDLLIEAREGTTAILTLNYPERRNALAIPMRSCFAETFERLEADREVRAVVITGGDSVFSSGGDISGMDAADLTTARARFRLAHC